MADNSRYILSRLFIAAPELQLDKTLLEALKVSGLVTQAEIDTAAKVRQRSKKYAQLASSMRDKTLVQRLMLVVPEIMSVSTIDFLRRYDLVSPTLGNALRVGLRGGKVIASGKVSEGTALQRAAALGSGFLTGNTVNLLRDLDNARIEHLRNVLPDTPENRAALAELLRISIVRGEQLRSVISTGRLSAETLAAARNANTVWGILTVVAEGLLSERFLRDAVRAGAISPERYDLILALNKLGLNVWKKVAAAIEHDSFAARALLISEGILSPELITALLRAGVISKQAAALMYPSASAIRAITRGNMDNYRKGIRARVVPGEPPIRTYARITQTTDQYLLKLLAEAAAQSRKEAEALARSRKFGALTRSAQKQVATDMLHRQMRIVFEGVGHLTIFGEKESARAAMDSIDFLQRRLFRKTGADARDFERAIRRSAEAGVDAFISRSENVRELSSRLYKNHAVARGMVSRRVDLALLRGLSAREFAADVSGLIRPGTRGGVSYVATRLARTEINNAFHFSQFRYTREMPWVEGYKWNLSGSHPKLDICNTFAQRNHDGIGRGVYKKGNVPGKPHPHCFCYLTTVTTPPGKFEQQLKRGSYNNYLKQVERSGVFQEGSWHSAYQQQLKEVESFARTSLAIRATKAIAPLAMSAVFSALIG